MRFFDLFKKKYHDNPAINTLYHSVPSLDEKVTVIIPHLPKLAKTFQEGGDYLLQKTLLDPIAEYDTQYDSRLSKRLDDANRDEMRRTVISMMLVTFFAELSEMLPDGPSVSALTDALHYEIYQSLPTEESFVGYLTYKNSNFEDSKMAPAYKFGNDIAAIVGVPDLSFPFMVAQQVAVISDISRRLTRWVLLNEPLDSAPPSPHETAQSSANETALPSE